MSEMHLSSKIGHSDIELLATRKGFGQGLKELGDEDDSIVALCADLTESTQMHLFRNAHPDRFIQVGVAEQNLASVASGVASTGRTAFISSYSAFSPGRNWEQIRTTICLNEQPVKIIGSHAGLSVGPDGSTHQMLEDIALMRVLPGMVVVAPGDAVEARKAVRAIANNSKPSYLRLARFDSPVYTTEKTPFEVGKAYVYKPGTDVSIMATGLMTYHCLLASRELEKLGISAEVIHVPTIKPIDKKTLVESAKKTGRVITVEEAQIAGGFGSAVSEVLSAYCPVPLWRMGMDDHFGESGEPKELYEKFGLDPAGIVKKVQEFISVTEVED